MDGIKALGGVTVDAQGIVSFGVDEPMKCAAADMVLRVDEPMKCSAADTVLRVDEPMKCSAADTVLRVDERDFYAT